MVVKVGDTVLIDGERRTIARLTKGGLAWDSDGNMFDLWFNVVEKLA